MIRKGFLHKISPQLKNCWKLSSLFSKSYDVAVLGGGPGGYVAAIRAGQMGLKTVCIETRDLLGGTCLNVGCIPSKTLLHISHQYHEAKHDFSQIGIKTGNVGYDWSKIQKERKSTIKGLATGIEGLFKKNKVDWVQGWGKITGKNQINVALSKGGKKQITAKNIILATGSEVVPFPGVEFDEKVIVSSTGALAASKVPKSFISIGGGVIGLELGTVYKNLGSKVTVVEFGKQICTTADMDITAEYKRILTQRGMKINCSTKVILIKKVKGKAQVVVESANGGNKRTLEADMCLVSIGRRAMVKGIGLDDVGIKLSEQGQIAINKHRQTNIPNIYAIGDCVPGLMLAHKSSEEGVAVIDHIKHGQSSVSYDVIPSVIYTQPEVAQVGRTEQELKADGVQYKVGKFPFMANSRSRVNKATNGFIKVLSSSVSGRILGVHIMGQDAGEMIHEAVVAMEFGATDHDIASLSHGHPTLSEAMMEACRDSAFGSPIHF